MCWCRSRSSPTLTSDANVSATGPRKVDKARLDVDADQLHPHVIAEVETLSALHDFSFHRRMGDAHPRPLLGRAGDDGLEAIADAIRKKQSAGRLPYLTLHFVRRIFGLRAVLRQRRKLVFAV